MKSNSISMQEDMLEDVHVVHLEKRPGRRILEGILHHRPGRQGQRHPAPGFGWPGEAWGLSPNPPADRPPETRVRVEQCRPPDSNRLAQAGRGTPS